ncbi:uncharacterized protein I303_100501 [Kwoniella dejecticola CBS 10117]|uniref:RNA polymerase II-associated protein 3 n=1 Tax=Kwoniella dejecticola CBS 10117 TaxID=1296121 RepID=A0AAJ8MD65_9TREE
MSVKVDVEKSDKSRADGNTSFKKGKWVEAIGHYTNAIVYNPTNPLAYSNRAQAFLKLDKLNDAERDCTTCLELDEGNIKALYRRGLARKGLNKVEEAIQDLERIIKTDQTNEVVKSELEELYNLRRKNEQDKAKPRRPLTPPSIANSNARSKSTISTGASIQEISDKAETIKLDAKGPNPDPQTTVNATGEDKSKGVPPDARSANSFASLRQAREGKKKAFVNGSSPSSSGPSPPEIQNEGVIRSERHGQIPSVDPQPNHRDTGSRPRDEDALGKISKQETSASICSGEAIKAQSRSSTTTSESPATPSEPTLPTNLDTQSTLPGAGLIFLRYLTTSPSFNFELISMYEPEVLSTILMNLLEPDILGTILQALNAGLQSDSLNQNKDEDEDKGREEEKAKIRIGRYLIELKKTKRWKMNYGMLSKAEKSIVEKIGRECQCEKELR